MIVNNWYTSQPPLGNPLYAYFEADGYTEYKCLTPRKGKRSTKGDTKRLGNRLIGIIVFCGSINTRFVYSLNDLVFGGANTMVEVMRQGISIIIRTFRIFVLL